MRRYLWITGLTVACGTPAEPEIESSGSTSSSSSSSTVTSSTTSTDPSTSSASSSTTAAPTSDTDPTGATTGGTLQTPCEDFDAFVESLGGVDPVEATTMAEAELQSIAYSEFGLPLRCADGRTGFVLLQTDAAAPTVAGEFNDWDPSALSTSQPVDGVPLFVAYAGPGEALGSAYKFVFEGSDFVADPRARRFDWDEFGEYSITGPRPGSGHHERWPDFDQGIDPLSPRDVTVWVPPDLDPSNPLPVLYLQDGQNLFDPSAPFGGWGASATAADAIQSGSLSPVLLVGIDNTAARFDEYSHTTEDLGNGPVGGSGGDYADFIVDGLKPFVDERYPTRTDRDATGIMGSSMGGLISLYTAWRHPAVFGFAASMSGTLWWGEGGPEGSTIIDLFAADPPSGLGVYLDSGGDPPCPGASDNYCAAVQMRDALVNAGWTEGVDLHYVWAPGAAHNEAAWAARFAGALQVWFPGSSR